MSTYLCWSNSKASSYRLWNLVFLRLISGLIKIYLAWLSKPIIQVMIKRNMMQRGVWTVHSGLNKILSNKVVAVLKSSTSILLCSLLVRGLGKPNGFCSASCEQTSSTCLLIMKCIHILADKQFISQSQWDLCTIGQLPQHCQRWSITGPNIWMMAMKYIYVLSFFFLIKRF